MHITNDMIHPQLRLRGRLLRAVMSRQSQSTLRRLHRLMKPMQRRKARKLKDMQVEHVFIDSGGYRLRLCVYRPLTNTRNMPGLLWIHGGGYAIGKPEQDERFIRNFIKTVPCLVVAPDYRKSPDAPYPAALDDCMAALVWLRDHAVEYGVASDQLMAGGDSAGGGLTAALTLRARDEGGPAIAFQMPLYPMLDDRMTTPSSRDNNAPGWDSIANENAWKLYLGELYGSDSIPVYAVPARCADLSGLPPAFTFVGSIEPFLDETKEYMERLRDAGVSAEYKVYEGCYHGFDILCAGSDPAKEATALLLDSFRRACEQYRAPQPNTKQH